MNIVNPRAVHVLKKPVVFAPQVLKAFQANQGLLLAGAVAYYALLSIVPLLILMVIALSQVSVVYGSLTTAIIVLLSLEVAATLLLLGAQVIAEYESVETGVSKKPPVSMRTDTA